MLTPSRSRFRKTFCTSAKRQNPAGWRAERRIFAGLAVDRRRLTGRIHRQQTAAAGRPARDLGAEQLEPVRTGRKLEVVSNMDWRDHDTQIEGQLTPE